MNEPETENKNHQQDTNSQVNRLIYIMLPLMMIVSDINIIIFLRLDNFSMA